MGTLRLRDRVRWVEEQVAVDLGATVDDVIDVIKDEATEDILKRSEDATPPWAAPRLIGHRGCGKTSRPVLHPHSI